MKLTPVLLFNLYWRVFSTYWQSKKKTEERRWYRGRVVRALAPVVQTLVSAIHGIKIYPVDRAIGFPNICPLDSDLSGG